MVKDVVGLAGIVSVTGIVIPVSEKKQMKLKHIPKIDGKKRDGVLIPVTYLFCRILPTCVITEELQKGTALADSYWCVNAIAVYMHL